MKLHSPAFEKRLRRAAREAVRRSPELQKQARRAHKAKHYSSRAIIRLGILAALGLGVWWCANHSRNLNTALAFISLWMFIWLCVRVQGALSCLFSDPELYAFSVLPIAPASIFRWQFQKFARAALMSLLDLVVALGVFGTYHEFGPGKWVMLMIIAGLSWVMFLALVLLCAARWPGLPYGLVPGLAMFTGAICLFGQELIGKYLLPLLEKWTPEIILLPTGWPLLQARLLTGEADWRIALLLIPIAGVILTLKSSLSRLRANYQFTEITLDEAPDLIHDDSEPVPAVPTLSPGPALRVGVTEIEEIILSRLGFAGVKWQEAGRLERLLWRWLSPRERALSEFVFPAGFAIAKPWWQTFRNLLVGVLAAYLIGWVFPGAQNWVLGLGLFVSLCQALVQILGSGQAFQPVQCNGVNIPMYAVYGIGFRELGRLLFKCSLVQTPLFVPFITVCATVISYMSGWPLAQGAMLGVKAGGLLLAARLITVTLAFSSGSNDTMRFRLRTLALLAMMICLALVFLGLAAASLFIPVAAAGVAPMGVLAWGLFGLAALDAYALFRIYGWFYHANRFDLMKAVQ